MQTGVISKIEEWLYCPKSGFIRTKFHIKPDRGDELIFIKADIPKYLLKHSEIAIGDKIKWDALEIFLTIMDVKGCPFSRVIGQSEMIRQ